MKAVTLPPLGDRDKYAKKTTYSKIFFSTSTHVGKKLGAWLQRYMYMKSHTKILKFVALGKESGANLAIYNENE